MELADLGIRSYRLSAGTPGASKRVVFILAHPDDETFSCGGAIARYAATGAAVYLVCATNGECGTIAPDLLGERSVAEYRLGELLCAARTLGLHEVHLLNYRDSGMTGTPAGQYQGAFTTVPPTEVIGKLVALLRVIRPQVVVTHGPYGGYGHPDHIRLYETATEAFRLASDPHAFAEYLAAGLAVWSSQRLYYTTYDPGPTKLFIALLRLLGQDPSRYGEHGDINLVEAVQQATPVTCAIEARSWLAIKERSFHCHRSQLGFFAFVLRLPRPVRRRYFASEGYTRAIPPVASGETREQDFFPTVEV